MNYGCIIIIYHNSRTKQNKTKQNKTKQTLILNDTFSLYDDKRGDKYSDIQCPKCSTQMQLMQRYEAFIDYCPSCKGVWLDRGEIDKIAQVQSSYDDEHYNNYHYRNGVYDDYYYNNRRRRGFFW